MKSILTIKAFDKILTVVYDHETKKFTPDVEHDEQCLRIIDNAVVESRMKCLIWPDFGDLVFAKKYRDSKCDVTVWFEDNQGSTEDKLRFLSYLCHVRTDVDDHGNVEFVKDRFVNHNSQTQTKRTK